MFTSRRLAPPRTCSSATSTAPAKSSASMSRRKRAEPVTFVRSPIITKPVSGPISNGSSPLNRGAARLSGTCLGDCPWVSGHDGLDVFGRRAAAAADEVHEPVARELAEVAARVRRQLVVRAELVREPGVRMARDVRRRDAREILDERPHLLRAERAVDADDERLRVLDRRPERLDRLPREVAPAHVDRGEREPERKLAAPPPARRRSRPSRSACRRSSRSAAGRRRPRRAPRSAPRTPRARRRTSPRGTRGRRPSARATA